jgi:hypothetical protein
MLWRTRKHTLCICTRNTTYHDLQRACMIRTYTTLVIGNVVRAGMEDYSCIQHSLGVASCCHVALATLQSKHCAQLILSCTMLHCARYAMICHLIVLGHWHRVIIKLFLQHGLCVNKPPFVATSLGVMMADLWWNVCCRCLQHERPASVLQLIAAHTESQCASDLEQSWLVDALEQYAACCTLFAACCAFHHKAILLVSFLESTSLSVASTAVWPALRT